MAVSTKESTMTQAEARRLLDSVALNPPLPYHNGCAKLVLTSLINSFRLCGLYYEHDFYQSIRSEASPSSTKITSLSSQSSIESYENGNSVKKNELNVMKNQLGPPAVTSPILSKTRKFQSSKIHSLASPTKKDIFVINTLDHKTLANQTPSNNSFEDTKTMDYSHDRKDEKNWNTEKEILGASKIEESLSRPLSSPLFTASSASSSSLLHRSLEEPGDYLARCRVIEDEIPPSVRQSLGSCVSKRVETEKRDDTLRSSSSGWRQLISDRTWAAIVLAILWLNFIRLAQYFIIDYGASFVMIVIPVLWYLQTITGATVLFSSCTNQNHFRLFFIRWRFVFADSVTRSLGMRGWTSKKLLPYLIFFQWLINAINMASCIFIMTMDDSFSGGMNRVLCLSGHCNILTIVGSSVVILFCTCAYTGPPILIVAFCHLICSHFAEFEVLAAGNKFPKYLRMLRECHLAMCSTVEIMDRYMRVACGCIFGNAIVAACFLLYVLINVSMDTTVILIGTFWLTSSVTLVGIITHHLGAVSTAMHSVGESLQTVQTKGATNEQLGQLQMFLSKVHGPTMGFTMFGLITVTKELSLTLLSLYITYAVVLLQFQ